MSLCSLFYSKKGQFKLIKMSIYHVNVLDLAVCVNIDFILVTFHHLREWCICQGGRGHIITGSLDRGVEDWEEEFRLQMKCYVSFCL